MFQNGTKFSNCNEEENPINPNCQMRHGARNFKNRKKREREIVFNLSWMPGKECFPEALRLLMENKSF